MYNGKNDYRQTTTTMKGKTFLTALAALSMVLGACGEKQTSKEQEAAQSASAAVEKKTDGKASQADGAELAGNEKAAETTPIAAISSAWASKSLKGIAPGGKADIERFALAFTQEYGEYKPNKVLCIYLKYPANYKEKLDAEEANLFEVYNKKKSGYISCRAMVQYSWDTECCYWKRNNRHQLVAFWLVEEHENSDGEHLLAFYDYDPATDTMTPEPAITKRVDEAMVPYDDYTIRLPEQGKDIELIGHKINIEEDNCENTGYLLRWNGNDFKIERTKE